MGTTLVKWLQNTGVSSRPWTFRTLVDCRNA